MSLDVSAVRTPQAAQQRINQSGLFAAQASPGKKNKQVSGIRTGRIVFLQNTGVGIHLELSVKHTCIDFM